MVIAVGLILVQWRLILIILFWIRLLKWWDQTFFIELEGHWPITWDLMDRLNSGNFTIFWLREGKFKLNSSYYRALRISEHDTQLEPISWRLNVESLLWNICVGVWVGGQDTTNYSYISKDTQENSASWDTNDVLEHGGENMVFDEKPTKNRKLRGLKLRGSTQINVIRITH